MIIIAWLIAASVALPLLAFSIECLAGLPSTSDAAPVGSAPPFVVLIPAHDEAAGIGAVIDIVRGELRRCDQLLVIADNCTDATATVARQAGATVCTRFDSTRLGKAYALAFGRESLRHDPPPVVIVLDADCAPEPDALARLASTAARHNAAVQARNLLSIRPQASPMVRISTFAFLVKNLVRQRGLQRLSAAAHLQGTGMAFPWSMFAKAPLANASLVEDMRLGLELSLSGNRVLFEESAAVYSPAASLAATRSQRTRWEHGAMTTAAEYLPRLLAAGLLGRANLLVVAADMLIPPLALLVSSTLATLAVLALFALGSGHVMPLLLIITSTVVFAGALLATWHAHGRAILPVSALLHLPQYLVWKQPIYARFILQRQRRWIRTSRRP